MSSHLTPARDKFTSAIHSALSLEEVGKAFLDTAKYVIPADAVGLYRFPQPTRQPVEVLSNAHREFLQAYEDHGRGDDPVLDFVLAHRRPIDSSRAAARPRWQNSGARAVLAEAGLRQSLEAPLLVAGKLIGTVNFARSSPADQFDTDDLISARILSEQLSLAVERAMRYEQAERCSAAMKAALDRVNEGIVVSDLNDGIVYSNRAARRMIEAGTRATGHDRPMMMKIISEASDALSAGRRVHSGSARLPDGSGHVVAKSWLQGDRHGAVVTVLNHAPSGEKGDQPALSVLSAREREIARLVSEGLTSKQIAERAYITENTVKQHLKRIFAKTDVRNRAELVQLIWASRSTG